MKSGVGVRDTTASRVGATGSSTASTAAKATSRVRRISPAGPVNASACSSHNASSSPTTGMTTRDSRVVITESKTGSLASALYGVGMCVCCFCRTSRIGPSDSAANTTPTIAAARTSIRRHISTTTSTAKTSSGQPKNEFCSAEFCDTWVAACGSPASEVPENEKYEYTSAPNSRAVEEMPW